MRLGIGLLNIGFGVFLLLLGSPMGFCNLTLGMVLIALCEEIR